MTARLVALVSGRGSNMLAIADACDAGRLPARVVRVIANVADAPALEAARTRGIQTVVVPHRAFAGRDAFDAALGDAIAAARPDWVVLAGFMRVLGASLVNRFAGRTLNIHPSLLPAYPGLDTHARALAAGEREHGASVHLVTAELDAGPVILQARVPVLDDDDATTLAARVLSREHDLYVAALARCLTRDKQNGATVAASSRTLEP